MRPRHFLFPTLLLLIVVLLLNTERAAMRERQEQRDRLTERRETETLLREVEVQRQSFGPSPRQIDYLPSRTGYFWDTADRPKK